VCFACSNGPGQQKPPRDRWLGGIHFYHFQGSALLIIFGFIVAKRDILKQGGDFGGGKKGSPVQQSAFFAGPGFLIDAPMEFLLDHQQTGASAMLALLNGFLEAQKLRLFVNRKTLSIAVRVRHGFSPSYGFQNVV